MNVRTLCLAILNGGDSTGYEIRKLVTDGYFSHFVDASYGSIYPSLNRLEEDGLVTSREELQPGKPARKVYSITDDGRSEFLVSLSKPAQKDNFKSEFLLLAMRAELMQPGDLKRAIDAQVDYLQSELEIIDTALMETDMLGGDWVANYGRSCLRSGLNYILKHRSELEALAGRSSALRSDVIAAE